MDIRGCVFGVALLTAATAAAQVQPTLEIQPLPSPVTAASEAALPASLPRRLQTRDGLWANGGLGWGSAVCQYCLGRRGGFTGGLSAGTAVSPRVLVGVGTSGWYKTVDGVALSGGTLDGRIRFYPSAGSGFFLTGGLGVGHTSGRFNGLAAETQYGVGALYGLGWDIRVARNLSLTPFYNGFAVHTANVDGNVGQFGVGITIH